MVKNCIRCERKITLTAVGIVVALLLCAFQLQSDFKKKKKAILEQVHKLGQTQTPKSLETLEHIFRSEPLRYTRQRNAKYIRTAVVKELKRLGTPEACKTLVSLAREYLPNGTQSGYYGRRYKRSPEYIEVTKVIFNALTRCHGSDTVNFVERVLENDQFEYEQQACLYAARAKILLGLRKQAIVGARQKVDEIVHFLQDGIPHRKDYLRPGFRKKTASLDLAALNMLVEMGVEALPALRKEAVRQRQVGNPKKEGAIVLAITRIIATKWKTIPEEERGVCRKTVLQYLKKHSNKLNLGSVVWYVRNAVRNLSAREDLSILHKIGDSHQNQEERVERIRKRVEQARDERRKRQLEAMSAEEVERLEQVQSVSAGEVSNKLSVLIDHLEVSTNHKTEKTIIELLKRFVADHPKSNAWSKARLKKLLLIAEEKERSVCAEIGKVIGRIARSSVREIVEFGIETRSRNVQFCSLMALKENTYMGLLPQVVEFLDSTDVDLRVLSKRIFESVDVATYRRDGAAIMQQIKQMHEGAPIRAPVKSDNP